MRRQSIAELLVRDDGRAARWDSRCILADRNGVSLMKEADARFACGQWRDHQLPNGLENSLEVLVVLARFAFKFFELAGEIFVRGHNFAEPHEGAHDRDIDFDRTVAPEYARKHSYALLGENVGEEFAVLAPSGL